MTSNSSGGLVSAIDQEAYGNVKIGSQSGYHLTTKEYDSSPELYYFWQRWYDPLFGIFISKTIVPPFYEHSYNSFKNNSLLFIDVNGMDPINNGIFKRKPKHNDSFERWKQLCDRLCGVAEYVGFPKVLSGFCKIYCWAGAIPKCPSVKLLDCKNRLTKCYDDCDKLYELETGANDRCRGWCNLANRLCEEAVKEESKK
jgi:RHS repeat-associated protein